MGWEVRSWARVVDVLVNTVANAIFDVGTTVTRCPILEGLWVGDVCVLPIHTLRMLRICFMLRRVGGCQIDRQEDEDLLCLAYTAAWRCLKECKRAKTYYADPHGRGKKVETITTCTKTG